MLPRAQRLRTREEFQRVYRHGRSWAHPLLVLHVLPQPDGQRFGVTVGSRVGKAVERNRVRRRLREILREQSREWKTGFDAVVAARPDAAEADFAELAEAVRELARRAGLRREPGEPPDAPFIPTGGRPARSERATERKRTAPAGHGAGAARRK